MESYQQSTQHEFAKNGKRLCKKKKFIKKILGNNCDI